MNRYIVQVGHYLQDGAIVASVISKETQWHCYANDTKQALLKYDSYRQAKRDITPYIIIDCYQDTTPLS